MQCLANLAKFKSCLSSRCLHSTAPRTYPRLQIPRKPHAQLAQTGILLDGPEPKEPVIPYEEQQGYGSSSAGHLLLRQQRHMLKYMRLIEHDMPNLTKFREPFTPPSSDRPLVVRTINYGGEKHPAAAKRTVVVSVARLPLHGSQARRNLKLLAGPRWSPSPPLDAGIGPTEGESGEGYIKISCEDFPQPGMNLKWISDVLDRLIAEANASHDRFAKVPLDTRHIDAKKRKAKTGEKYRPTLKEFPRQWLPQIDPA
ncbi:hypothetical protein EW145_g4317 [Phellinidium pouzarii]|uniref:Small ribosomal subunit protein mS35 mitochondrial conserved domain-containing protein n=1 Tax=Phellinidium pouzarii TaxID=167371 RepID=A0A4S4L3Y8_9AGAM|nr:hypothetical protein EW145_g4317 [Phellinidium pouzarii]